MDLKVIVMITTLALPGGDASVQVKTFPGTADCIAAADIEATDPFVHAVECAELEDGVLTLHFGPQDSTSSEQSKAAPTG